MLFHRLVPPRWQMGSTESQQDTSDTNHSSHDDFLNHILACMPLSPWQANNVRLHIETTGSVITSVSVDVLSVGVCLCSSLLSRQSEVTDIIWTLLALLLEFYDLFCSLPACISGLKIAFAIHSVKWLHIHLFEWSGFYRSMIFRPLIYCRRQCPNSTTDIV